MFWSLHFSQKVVSYLTQVPEGSPEIPRGMFLMGMFLMLTRPEVMARRAHSIARTSLPRAVRCGALSHQVSKLPGSAMCQVAILPPCHGYSGGDPGGIPGGDPPGGIPKGDCQGVPGGDISGVSWGTQVVGYDPSLKTTRQVFLIGRLKHYVG